MYENARGVRQDYVLRWSWYRKAAEQGRRRRPVQPRQSVPRRSRRAAELRRSGEVVSDVRRSKATRCAQNNLAAYVRTSVNGVKQDHAEAVYWYRLAAEQGNALAQYNLGAAYENGLGVPQNYVEAMRWYRKAAYQNNAAAQFNVGTMYYCHRGVPQDFVEAAKWYRKAADQGNAYAQNNLAVMYENGQGVTKDYGEAMKWYEKAASQGNDAAQFSIGLRYDTGEGVRQDYAEAIAWYRRAAERGQCEGAEQPRPHVRRRPRRAAGLCRKPPSEFRRRGRSGRGRVPVQPGPRYEIGRGVPRDFEEAAKWYRQAADQEDATAQFNLGTMYYYGRGVRSGLSSRRTSGSRCPRRAFLPRWPRISSAALNNCQLRRCPPDAVADRGGAPAWRARGSPGDGRAVE